MSTIIKPPKGKGVDWSPRDFTVTFVRADHQQKHIYVYDGQIEVSHWTGNRVRKEIKLPIRYFSGEYEPKWVETLKPRQELKLMLPAWLVDIVGIKNAHDLQSTKSDERSHRVQSRS